MHHIKKAGVVCAIALAVTSIAEASPNILFDVSVAGTGAKSARVLQVGDVVPLDVRALVAGSDNDSTNDALVSAQFSLVTDTGGLLGDLAFVPNAMFDARVTNVPPATDYDGDGDKELGSGANSNGSNNNTVIINVGIDDGSPINMAEQLKIGEQVIDGVTYSVFDLGTSSITVDSQLLSDGELTHVMLVPRIGLGNLVRPEIAYIDGVTTELRGDDPAIQVTTPVTVQVPEPGTLGIVAAGAGISLGARRRSRR